MTLTIEIEDALGEQLARSAAKSHRTPQEEAILALEERLSARSPSTADSAAQAIKRILAARIAPDAPRLDLPPGVSFREYIHEDHG